MFNIFYEQNFKTWFYFWIFINIVIYDIKKWCFIITYWNLLKNNYNLIFKTYNFIGKIFSLILVSLNDNRIR